MSKQKRKNNNLPPLQKKILLDLASEHPATKNETSKRLNKHYRAVYTAMNSLEKKGLIGHLGSKEYRGNVYPTFWLTEEGILKAIQLGVAAATVLSSGEELYPEESQDWSFFRDLAYELGDLKFRELIKDFVAYEDGELRIKGLPYEEENAQEILQALFCVARKHPKYWRIMTKITQSCQKALEEFLDNHVQIETSTPA